jgi:3-phosphoshikimate 1-carboxyvinyltransferase
MTLPDVLEIEPLTGPLNANVRPPGSKSITNRALACAALADGESTLTGALDSDDTRVMIDGLRKLGIAVEVRDEGETLLVAGCGGNVPAASADLFVGNSGTTIRFLTPLVALGHSTFRLDGVQRMRERPIGDLLDALVQLGVDARSEANNGRPPVVVRANGLAGGTTRVRGDVSSQFLSGLLMAAPCAAQPVELAIEGRLVSRPYIGMTLRVMDAFGVAVNNSDDRNLFKVPNPGAYVARTYEIEPDASAASYFWAAAAIAGGSVTVEGLGQSSIQGDVAFVNCLEAMGCEVTRSADAITVNGRPLQGIDVDMNAISDTAQTLAAVALFAEGESVITGVGHMRHKETDRIAALATELRELGAYVEELSDGLVIDPAPLMPAELETYDDHRMAMSLALVGLRQPGVRIRNPSCVAKTYPNFFRDLQRLRSEL